MSRSRKAAILWATVPGAHAQDIETDKTGSGLRFTILPDRCWSGGVAPTRNPPAPWPEKRVRKSKVVSITSSRGNNRQTSFKCKDDFQKFLSQLEIQKHKLSHFLHAYCLMSITFIC